MEIGHNPQENPQIYLAISTHLNNILIKVHQFSKIIGVKNKKRKPTITWTLDASCYSKHQWVGTCFGMTNSSGVGLKCLLFVVCLWVFFDGGLWCLQKWYLLVFFGGPPGSCYSIFWHLKEIRSKTPPKMETCKKNANYLLCVVFLGGISSALIIIMEFLRWGCPTKGESLIFPMGFLCFHNTPNYQPLTWGFTSRKLYQEAGPQKEGLAFQPVWFWGDFSTDTPFT